MNLAQAYKDGDEKKIAEYAAKIEKKEGYVVNDDKHPLYSEKKGKIVPFAEKIVEMNEMYDDLMFELADNSNERIKDIKEFRAGEVIRFNRRILEKMKRKAKQHGNA